MAKKQQFEESATAVLDSDIEAALARDDQSDAGTVATLPDVQVQEQVEQPVTLADLIQSDVFYPLVYLEQITSIKTNAIVAEVQKYGGSKFFKQWRGGGTPEFNSVLGSEFLAWVEVEKIPYTLNRGVTEIHSKLRRQDAMRTAPSIKPAHQLTPVEAAAATVAKWQAEEQNSETEFVRSREAAYSRLIGKGDFTDADTDHLARLLIDLKISSATAQEDLRIVAEARRLKALHDGRQDAHAEYQAAITAYDAAVKLWRVQEEQLRHAKAAATAKTGECSNARYLLGRLAQRRPMLFDVTGDVAVLVGDIGK